MQFVQNGPDIPDQLLEAHEDGRVVFFCGAGISYPANLPGFKGLVDRIYTALGTIRTPSEDDAYQRSRYDTTLDLLERRIPGQRFAVRKELISALKPNLRKRDAKKTHAALLKLGFGRDGGMRLVTTNFDRIFESLIDRSKQKIQSYPAPLLPIPKISRWNGVVYLHGLLPKSEDESSLNRLVLTSGDFGLAYLTERWAARFVSELFRNFTVCFVGYSIDDPVLRYMMDALAADRMLGEAMPQAYALGEFATGKESQKKIEWQAKGVTPILFEVPTGTQDYSALHSTISQWADTYRDGVQGKERIIVECAMAKPIGSTKQDDYVGRMLWALSEKSGLPAKRFAEFNPVPSLEWLEALDQNRYGYFDLPKFGVLINSHSDEQMKFSMLRRPAPYEKAPWMTVGASNANGSGWDDVMHQLAGWLIRHLNDPALFLWLTKHGGRPNWQLLWLIERRLDELLKLERDGKTAELDSIRANGPNSIPSPIMRTLWRLLLAGRIR